MCNLSVTPRQLVLGAFVDHFQVTRHSDDVVLAAATSLLFFIPDFCALTRSFQEVMIALLARREFKNPAQIHSSAWNQNVIASAANVSRSTVKRAYAAFEANGWIVRSQQAYDTKHKRFEGTPIEIASSFVEALKLNRSFEAAAKELSYRVPAPACNSSPAKNDNEVKNVLPVVHSDPLSSDSKEQSLKRQSSAPAIRPKTVPSELSCLIEKGLSKWTVFWLMRLASEGNKRLSDLVQVFKAAIAKRSGQKLVGFLRLKISDGVDYGWRLKELQEVAEVQASINKSELELEAFDGQIVAVAGIQNPVHVERTGSGFYGRVEGQSAGIPHGQLVKLVRAKKITRHVVRNVEVVSNPPAAPQKQNRSAIQNAMAQMKSIVGNKRNQHAY